MRKRSTLALQPDPRRHAQAQRGLKGSASRQGHPTPALASNYFIEGLWGEVEGEDSEIRCPRPGQNLQEREEWVSGGAPSSRVPARRNPGGPAQIVVRITRISSLTRAFLGNVITAGPPATHPAPAPTR